MQCKRGKRKKKKKSHISLARYMVENLKDEELKHHKFSFYLGSILPDIKPSFLYKRHEMDGTFPYVSRHIRRLSEGDALIRKKKGCKYYRDLGQISHYLADYFTFPHNTIYPGSLKDHCSYEEKLKRDLRSYLKSGEATRHHRLLQLKEEHEKLQNKKKAEPLIDAEAICAFIQKSHDEYLAHKHGVEDDIEHIVEVNHKALDAMMKLLANKRAEWRIRHS